MMKHILSLLFILVSFNCYSIDIEIDMDIIKQIESSGNEYAYNESSGSKGLYQLREICIEDYNLYHTSNKIDYDNDEDMYDPLINEHVANWYITERIPGLLKSIDKDVTLENILVAYNAGYRKLISDESIPQKTKDYIVKYAEQLKNKYIDK